MSRLPLMRLLALRDAQPANLVGGIVLLGGIAAWYALRPADPPDSVVGAVYGFVGRYEALTSWTMAALALLIGIERTAEDAADGWLHPVTARQDVRTFYLLGSAAAIALAFSAFLTAGIAVHVSLGSRLSSSMVYTVGAVLVRVYAAALLGGVLVLLIRSKGLVLLLLMAWAAIPAAALYSVLMSQSGGAIPDVLRTLLRWSPLALVFEGPARFRIASQFAIVLTAVSILIAPFTVARRS